MTVRPGPGTSHAAAPATDAWAVASSRARHPSRGSASDAGWLWDVASGLAAVAVPWGAISEVPPATRVYERLIVTADYDVWLIHWPPGSGIGLHDHGDSAGAFCVADGELTELTQAGESTARERSAACGEGSVFPAGRLHSIANRRSRTATSVHVYSPPLLEMAFYEEDDTTAPPVRVENERDWRNGRDARDAEGA